MNEITEGWTSAALITGEGTGAASRDQALATLEAVFPGAELAVRPGSHTEAHGMHFWDVELPAAALAVADAQGWGEFGQEHIGLVVVGDPE